MQCGGPKDRNPAVGPSADSHLAWREVGDSWVDRCVRPHEHLSPAPTWPRSSGPSVLTLLAEEQPYTLSQLHLEVGPDCLQPAPPGSQGQAGTPSDHSAAASSTALKLFDDPDLGGAVALGDPLLLPAAHESGGPPSRLGPRETSEDLFRYHLHPVMLRQA